MKNLAALLLLSHGVPMLLAGDEFGRSQLGNNNAYCHDNELNWLDWSLVEKNSELFRFFKLLIQFRKEHPALRPRAFSNDGVSSVRLSWHGVNAFQPDWSDESRSVAVTISDDASGDELFIVANAYWEALQFAVPPCTVGRKWHKFLDTSQESPSDVTEVGKESYVCNEQAFNVAARSVIVFTARVPQV